MAALDPDEFNQEIDNKDHDNRISGGQLLRQHFARIFYLDPEFVFLDESTSALDSSNEQLIMENLRSQLGNRCVVIIGHRQSLNKYADQVQLLENGQPKEASIHV